MKKEKRKGKKGERGGKIARLAFLFFNFSLLICNVSAQEVFYSALDSDFANVLLLPVAGGTAEENRTLAVLIANLRDINDACHLIDESANSSIVPANFTGYSPVDSELLFKLAIQYKASYILHCYVQRFGQRNIAIISRYDTFKRRTDRAYYLEYSDPIEAWVKLPGVITQVMKSSDIKQRVITDHTPVSKSFWVRYQRGVDRVWAQRMIELLAADYVIANGGSLNNKTDIMEEQLEMRQGITDMIRRPGERTLIPKIPNKDWYAYIDNYIAEAVRRKEDSWLIPDPKYGNIKSTDVFSYLNEASEMGTTGSAPLINVSKQGNRTRFQLIYKSFTFIDVADTRDFVRQMRGFSLSWGSGVETKGYDLGIPTGRTYNWRTYAGEDSTMDDILTITNQFPATPQVLITGSGATTINLKITSIRGVGTSRLIFYCSTEDDFSKAKIANQRLIATHYHPPRPPDEDWQIVGLQPKTKYYVWVTRCYGYLLWLQSKPSERMIVNTKAE